MAVKKDSERERIKEERRRVCSEVRQVEGKLRKRKKFYMEKSCKCNSGLRIT